MNKLMVSFLTLCFSMSSPYRCCGQHWGEDASPGVCIEQEEGPGTAEPQPRRAPQRCPLLVPVRNSYCNTNLYIYKIIYLRPKHCNGCTLHTALWFFKAVEVKCRFFTAFCHHPSSRVLLHLQHCMSLTEWWIVHGIKQSSKYTCRLTFIHVTVGYWSLMIEAYSEQSALNIYCSISWALLLYLYAAFLCSSSLPSCAFIVSQRTFECLEMHLWWLN